MSGGTGAPGPQIEAVRAVQRRLRGLPPRGTAYSVPRHLPIRPVTGTGALPGLALHVSSVTESSLHLGEYASADRIAPPVDPSHLFRFPTLGYVQRLYDFLRRHPTGVDTFWAVVLFGFSFAVGALGAPAERPRA